MAHVDARWAQGESVPTTVTILLCGDVMTGRGVDQILPHPGDPTLQERFLHDARAYVELAEERNGEIPRPVAFDWPWGEALDVLREVNPDVRVINLETSITRSNEFWPGKAVNYRMSPDNVRCLAAAAPDVCTLANNHVLDFGRAGLIETLDVLAAADLFAVGAGCDLGAAQAPAIVSVPGGGRVIVISCGTGSSGIPQSWAATPDQPGVNLVPDLSDRSADVIIDSIGALKETGDVAVVSIHWGSNWGYDVPADQRHFAHRLVDGGIDIVHGHSSHHPRPIEIYRDRLILYGSGDFIDDYEGIGGYEQYRDDLRPMYFASLGPGGLTSLRITVLHARKMRLHRAALADAGWLQANLDRISWPFATSVDLEADGTLTARPIR